MNTGCESYPSKRATLRQKLGKMFRAKPDWSLVAVAAMLIGWPAFVFVELSVEFGRDLYLLVAFSALFGGWLPQAIYSENLGDLKAIVLFCFLFLGCMGWLVLLPWLVLRG